MWSLRSKWSQSPELHDRLQGILGSVVWDCDGCNDSESKIWQKPCLESLWLASYWVKSTSYIKENHWLEELKRIILVTEAVVRRCSSKYIAFVKFFCKIHRKTPVLGPLFNDQF